MKQHLKMLNSLSEPFKVFLFATKHKHAPGINRIQDHLQGLYNKNKKRSPPHLISKMHPENMETGLHPNIPRSPFSLFQAMKQKYMKAKTCRSA
jgi:hypothetical protein